MPPPEITGANSAATRRAFRRTMPLLAFRRTRPLAGQRRRWDALGMVLLRFLNWLFRLTGASELVVIGRASTDPLLGASPVPLERFCFLTIEAIGPSHLCWLRTVVVKPLHGRMWNGRSASGAWSVREHCPFIITAATTARAQNNHDVTLWCIATRLLIWKISWLSNTLSPKLHNKGK